MAFNLGSALANAKKSVNMTEAKAAAEYEPYAEGPVNLRLAGFIEVGKQEVQFGKDKPIEVKDMVYLLWELSGPKHKPKEIDGKTVPLIFVQEMTNTLTTKSLLFKQFTAMNKAYGGQYTHMGDMIGLAFRGKITHDPKKTGDKMYYNEKLVDIGKAERPEVLPDGDGGFAETGEMVAVKVDPMISKPMGFIFHHSGKDHWDSLYIEGEYPERKDDKGNVTKPAQSKNKWQLKIKAAKNWNECPMYPIVMGGATGEADAAAVNDLVGEADEVVSSGRPADAGDGVDID
ncbi:hypothetical protein [Xanthomonas phage SB3]|uniref:Single-stranded DNA-binding protein n=1 Tax=Xanthomonas phage SB3 TaxID=3117472 RepID=A0ABZ2GZF9_9CAUD